MSFTLDKITIDNLFCTVHYNCWLLMFNFKFQIFNLYNRDICKKAENFLEEYYFKNTVLFMLENENYLTAEGRNNFELVIFTNILF